MKLRHYMWTAVMVGLLAAGAGGDKARGDAATQAGGTKVEVVEGLSKDKKIEKLVALVTSEYERVLKAKDWMNRGLAMICLSRLPGKEATGLIMKTMEKDSVPIVRMIAWNCMAARSQAITEDEYKEFCATTWEMSDKGLFPGEMRVGLLRWLQYQPADARGRKLWLKIFSETNSQLWYYKYGRNAEDLVESASYEGNDKPVIMALAKVLGKWRDGELMGTMVKKIANLDEILRAEMVIQACARSPRPKTTELWWREGSEEMTKKAIEENDKWWKDEKDSWTGARAESADWRKLRSPYVPELKCLTQADIDPDDPSWKNDFELGNPNLKSLNVAFVVDATASMTPPMIRMRVDLKRLMTAMSMVSLEPRVSVTYYRDYGEDFLGKTIMPLVGPEKLDLGIHEMEKMKAIGGGDEPEAVLAGLKECVAKSGWPTPVEAKKIIIIIGDAPPHDGKLYPGDPHPHEKDDTVKLAKELAAKGFKIYAEKAVTGWEALDLSAFDEITAAAGGKAVTVTFPGVTPRQKGGHAPWAMLAWNESQRAWKESELHDGYTDLMAGILTDLISPRFKERVDPMVRMLLAGLSVNSRPERQLPWPKVEGNHVGPVNPQTGK